MPRRRIEDEPESAPRRSTASEDNPYPGRKERPPPESLGEFRKYDTEPQYFDFPEKSERRKCTDVAAIIICTVFILIWGILIVLCAIKMDFKRFVSSYDHCGDICGIQNKPVQGVGCSGSDYRNKPHLLYVDLRRREPLDHPYENHNDDHHDRDHNNDHVDEDEDEDEDEDQVENDNVNRYKRSKKSGHANYPIRPYKCVEACPPNTKLSNNNCYPKGVMEPWKQIGHDLYAALWVILACLGVAILVGTLMMICLRIWTSCTVYTFIILAYIIHLALLVLTWIAFLTSQNSAPWGIAIPILLTISFIFLVIFGICVRNRIKMVIYLYRMTMDIIGLMPCIMIQPWVTLIWTTIFGGLMVFSLLVILYSGDLKPVDYCNGANCYKPDFEEYDFKIGALQITAALFTLFMGLWMSLFVTACQDFVMAYPTISYYFARNKRSVRHPICRGYGVLVRFHLGTVLAGSLIMAIIKAIRMIVDYFTKDEADTNIIMCLVRCCVMCLLACIEDILEKFTKYAYVQCAMHGRPLCKSGLRGFLLAFKNLLDVLTFRMVTQFVSLSFIFCVALIAGLIGYGLLQLVKDMNFWVYPFLVILLEALFIGIMMINVVDMVMDGALMCYCEDKEVNDGVRRPYYMSRELMLYMEEQYEIERTGKKGCMQC